MLYVKKDKSSFINCGYACTPPEDSYVIEDIELEEKILQLFPDFDFVLDGGEVVDVISTKPEPVDVERQVERNTADIAYIAMMTDVELE